MVDEATGTPQKPGKRRGRPKTRPAPSKPDVKRPASLEDSARRNLTATFQLVGRLIGSQYQPKEEHFEETGKSIENIARDFPAAAPLLEQLVRALGPTAAAADLLDKFNRIFDKSKLKDQVEQKRASWRPPWERKEETSGADKAADL